MHKVYRTLQEEGLILGLEPIELILVLAITTICIQLATPVAALLVFAVLCMGFRYLHSTGKKNVLMSLIVFLQLPKRMYAYGADELTDERRLKDAPAWIKELARQSAGGKNA